MPSRLVLALCENELQRDRVFIETFCRVSKIEVRVTPTKSDRLGPKEARQIRRQAKDARDSGFAVSAVLVQRDADIATWESRRKEVETWFEDRLADLSVPLMVCVPTPSIECWLCKASRLKPRGKARGPAAGGDPWKKAWGRRTLEEVRMAAREARTALTGLPDFSAFLGDWENVFPRSPT